MNTVLDKNLELLKQNQPYLYNKLTGYIKGTYRPANSFVEKILLARQDDLVINMLVVCKGREFIICDHENPIEQAYAWIDKFIDPSARGEIVFGMGFGYHLEVLLTSFENKKVIIIEPDIELFYQVLKVRNLELLIKRAEIFVDESIDNILGRINALLWDADKTGVQCEPFEIYTEMFESFWDELKGKFIKHVQNFAVDIATRRHFGELWVYNNIKNANRLTEASNAGGLVKGFTGIPAVLVSAGPSLAKNIHLLKELKDKCVIMAAGTAVRILEQHGIIPHFMAGVDAAEAEARIHEGVKDQSIYFLYSNQVATGSLKAYSGPKFLMNYPVDIYTAQFFNYAGIKSDMILSGPSVANTGFDMLYKMGCNPIILVGQDLSLTGGSMYAGQERNTLIKDKPGESDEKYILTKDIYGNDVYTLSSFIAMKNWYEGYFERIGDTVEIINATEGGLNIEFAKNAKLADVIAGHNFAEVDIASRIREIHQNNRFNSNDLRKLAEYRKMQCDELDRLHRFCEEQLKLVELVKKDVYHPSKNKNMFDRIARKISELTDFVLASPIYGTMLKNLVEIEFYLIKQEVQRSTAGMTSYEQVKDIYVNAALVQNRMITEKLDRLREFMKED